MRSFEDEYNNMIILITYRHDLDIDMDVDMGIDTDMGMI